MTDIVWFRGKDLRYRNHPGVAAAGANALHVFVLDPYFFAPERAQQLPHRIQFLLDSLRSLETNIASRGGKLWCIRGRSDEVIPTLAERVGASRVFAMRWTEPFGRERDRRVAERLPCALHLLEGETLLPPGTLRSQSAKPYSVFSPFNRAFRRTYAGWKPDRVPDQLAPTATVPPEFGVGPVPTLADLGIKENPRILRGGESKARERLAAFITGPGDQYSVLRDRMDVEGTSRLSADLKFGVLAVGEVWQKVAESNLPEHERTKFADELVWREFNYSTLWDQPHVLREPFKPAWNGFPWQENAERLAAWKAGRTGYPVVDAAARQLLESGYVHNRARMIAASFLTKHLKLDYRFGEAHYLQWLTDGDWASNNMGWQWAAGSGADAQPWFRVFNPMTQGRRFDPDGNYVRRWVPELAKMDAKYIHAPWEAPGLLLRVAGVELGRDYPHPIVDHKTAREEFLAIAKQHMN